MRLLLDTQIILWSAFERTRLSRAATEALANETNTLYLSAVSAWELATKVPTGRLVLPETVPNFLNTQRRLLKLTDLPLTVAHAAAVAELPMIHRDPGDRLLVAQAMLEDLVLVTADRILQRYPVRTLW